MNRTGPNKNTGTVSMSVRFTKQEIDTFTEIVDRRNKNSEPYCRLSKTRVMLTVVLNWIAENKDNDNPFPPGPAYIVKHDI